MNHSTISIMPPGRSHPALALAALLLTGLAYTSAVRATITCLAPASGQTRTSVGTWRTAAHYYEVPLGGVLTSAAASINTRLSKSGTNFEDFYSEVTAISSSTYLRAPVEGHAIPGAPGLAIRLRLRTNQIHLLSVSPGVFELDRVSWQGFPEADYQYTQSFTIEIVRAAETLPGNTPWSIPADFPLPLTASLAFKSSTSPLAGAAACSTLNYTLSSHFATGAPPLPTRSPQPITCTLDINNGDPRVDFGPILVNRMNQIGAPPTGFTKHTFNVRYHCSNTPNPATPTYTLSWHGTPATGKPYALQVIEDNRRKAGVGIVMESESGNPPVVKVLELETGRVAASQAGRTGGNSVKFHAYPIRTDNSAITPGSFKGTATIRINLY